MCIERDMAMMAAAMARSSPWSVMLAHDEVMECHMVAGGFDYLLKVRVTDMESYRRFLGDRIAAVRGVQQTHTYFVMEEVKSTHRIIVLES